MTPCGHVCHPRLMTIVWIAVVHVYEIWFLVISHLSPFVYMQVIDLVFLPICLSEKSIEIGHNYRKLPQRYIYIEREMITCERYIRTKPHRQTINKQWVTFLRCGGSEPWLHVVQDVNTAHSPEFAAVDQVMYCPAKYMNIGFLWGFTQTRILDCRCGSGTGHKKVNRWGDG